MKKLVLSALMLCLGGAALAAEIPRSGPDDARVRLVAYRAHEVTVIKVQRGTATRIVLSPDEKILIPVSGMSARCDNDMDEWCISAPLGGYQIFVRPKDRATRNNLELHTNKRDYSFEFVVLPDAQDDQGRARSNANSPYFRVQFEYPAPPPVERNSAVAELLAKLEPAVAAVSNRLDTEADMSPAAQLKLRSPELRNTNYTMQVLEKGEDAAPSLVFDDGRFTYFEFKGTREIPAIFAAGSDGQANRVNWHMQPPFVVVQRTARKFTLRLGAAVVGIFNEDFDAVGIDTPSATISPTIIRDVKEVQP